MASPRSISDASFALRLFLALGLRSCFLTLTLARAMSSFCSNFRIESRSTVARIPDTLSSVLPRRYHVLDLFCYPSRHFVIWSLLPGTYICVIRILSGITSESFVRSMLSVKHATPPNQFQLLTSAVVLHGASFVLRRVFG